MKQYKCLHLANSIQALNLIAQGKAIKGSNFKKPERLMDLAKKIYITSQKDPLDEEMTYVLLFRFIQVYDQLIVAYKDQVFVSAMLGKEIRNAKAQINDLKNSLINRYEENEAKRIANTLPSIESPTAHETSDIIHTVFSNALFISCSELFKAVTNEEVNLLVLDARAPLDFAQSCIKGVTCINIPDNCIQSGLSAHKLGTTLPSSSVDNWEKRDTFDVLVLLDWYTCKTNFALSKLDKLRTILVDWDFNRNYNEKPVVLDGGYSEWLEMYPTFCTNPNVKYVNANIDLDDLLNLDVIEYPTDEESKSHEIFKQEIAKAVVDNIKNECNQSRDEILEQEKALSEKNKEIGKELLNNELRWKDVQELIEKENDIGKLQELEIKKQEVEEIITQLTKEEDDLIEKKSKLADQFNLNVSFKPGEMEFEDTSKKLEDIDKLHKENLDLYKARQAFAVDRQRLLDEARLLKKPRVDTKPDELKSYTIPIINRAVKPKVDSPKIINHIDGIFQYIKNGLTGLQNIKNTCYMNTVIQCLRHVPEIIEFYCNGDYTKHLSRTPPVISNEFAHLVRALWSNSYSIIRPTEFYNKITALSPAYKAGYHEDCMEFFLQLFNYLSDDCSLDISSKSDWNETQMAWYKQHGGKISVYTNMFYHQIRVQRSCKECHINSLKFEIDNVFYLPIPETTFSLEQCMQTYLSSTEKVICKKCKKPTNTKKNFAFYPPILVISLKRHMQDFIENNTVFYKKNQSICNFPVDNFQIGKLNYKLRAVALHIGTMQSGHYTAACLNPITNKWYLFNDEEVSLIDINDTSIKIKAYAFFYSVKREVHAG